MSSAGSSSGGKAVSVIVVLGVLVVALLAYNKICDECIFAFPEKGGGESGQSVIVGGAAPQPQPAGFDFGSILAAILIIGLLAGGAFVLTRRRQRAPPPVYGGPGPVAVPPYSTPTYVAPHNWPDAIDHLADSNADSALIEGRAAITLLTQAAKYQKAGNLESFSGLFGNFHHKTKKAVVLFAIPFPVTFASHLSVAPDWNLFKDVKKLAEAEFIYGDKAAVDALLKDYEDKFRHYKSGYPPNVIINDLIKHKGLFNPITKKHLSKVANYLEGFEKGRIFPVGWYHNHPLDPSYPTAYIDLLTKPSGSDPADAYYKKGDLACQCFFQHEWKGNNPVSALVATRVRQSDKVAEVLEEALSLRIWKSSGCKSTAATGVTSTGFADVKYKIFCMDEDTYKWYLKNAPRLVEEGIVLKWYEEYYEKYVKPDRKSKKIPTAEYKKQKGGKSIFDRHFEDKKNKKGEKSEEDTIRGKFE